MKKAWVFLLLLLCCAPAAQGKVCDRVVCVTVHSVETSTLLTQAPPEEADVAALARIIHWEARGEGEEGMLAVACVVLNRVESDLFPNSIEEVVAQRGQFSPYTCDNYFSVAVDEACVDAAREALSGTRPLDRDVLFFHSGPVQATWCGAAHVTTIGGHHFYAP